MSPEVKIIDPNEMLYHYNALVRYTYDGDTTWFWTDLGKGIWEMGTQSHKEPDLDVGFEVVLPRGEPHRFNRIDTPEIRTRDKEEKARAIAARDYVRGLIPKWSRVFIQTFKDKKGGRGRWLAEIWFKKPIAEDGSENGKWVNLNDLLVAQGHAVYKEY